MHREFTDQLSAYLDGELDLVARRRVEVHLAECTDCAEVARELRNVVGWAHAYEGEAPARDGWPALRLRIDAARQHRFPAVARLERRYTWRHLVAAGLLMAATGGAGVWLAVRGAGPGGARPADPPPVVTVVNAAPDDLAVRDLQELLASGRTQLDSSTVRVVEQSLRLIDEAIAEARDAIQRDSSNAYLNGRIAAHMRQKLAILRMATRASGAET